MRLIFCNVICTNTIINSNEIVLYSSDLCSNKTKHLKSHYSFHLEHIDGQLIMINNVVIFFGEN